MVLFKNFKVHDLKNTQNNVQNVEKTIATTSGERDGGHCMKFISSGKKLHGRT
jgi:hypothetical protein